MRNAVLSVIASCVVLICRHKVVVAPPPPISADYLDTAKNRFQQALNIRTTYAAAECGLGRVLQRQNDADAALNRFDRAIRFAPNFADAYLSRATIRADRRQTADALSDLDRSIQLFDQQIAVSDAAIE